MTAAVVLVGSRTTWHISWYILTIIQCVAGQCVIIPEVYYGAGRHIEYILPAHFPIAFRLNFVTQPLYLVAICLTKVSIGLFLLRIAVEPFYRRLIIGVIGMCIHILSPVISLMMVRVYGILYHRRVLHHCPTVHRSASPVGSYGQRHLLAHADSKGTKLYKSVTEYSHGHLVLNRDSGKNNATTMYHIFVLTLPRSLCYGTCR